MHPRDPNPLARFGRQCPICGAPLGKVDDLKKGTDTTRFERPPSFLLEVGPYEPGHGQAYRVRSLSLNYPPVVSTDPPFREYEVEYSYLLCGDGHIFPDNTRILRKGKINTVDGWNMVAAIGAPAVGKTYLLVRMLNQSLVNVEHIGPPDGEHMTIDAPSPLEEVPLRLRESMYESTRTEGAAIRPTGADEVGTPADILSEELPGSLALIRELIQKIVQGGARQAERWGQGFRQPLMLRTKTGNRRVWTGIADLPGELFDRSARQPRELSKLRGFDSLIWVLDPLLGPHALTWLWAKDTADLEAKLDASLRPGAIAGSTSYTVRTNRGRIQNHIGKQLSMNDGLIVDPDGGYLHLMVTVTKCDLIREALDHGRHLTDLGGEGVVERAVARYLSTISQRFGQGHINAEGEVAALLQYLSDGHHPICTHRCYQVARGLLSHYSDPDHFWDLVERGTENRFKIDDNGTMDTYHVSLRVPSISDHLRQALQPHASGRFLMRDLIMSAIGCGIASGAGQEQNITSVLNLEWMRPRFFLCSPLGTVPKSTGAQIYPAHTIDAFPDETERSAALTQLFLAVLERARG